jgi:hypothetical protein
MPEQLQPVDIPAAIIYIWQWFCELSGGRGYSEAGPGALTYSEILAWAQLTKSDPMAWEVEALKELDRVYLTESSKK